MLGMQIKRLVKQSAIYGLGGIVSRLLAVLLLPLYTSYLGTTGFGKIETIVALTPSSASTSTRPTPSGARSSCGRPSGSR
jgi:hypothetical protein